ncbi:MAG TPA: aldehyde dehydrogenase family protein, partial [Acidimicrobiia bacterium]|nr:aldehyde dehydrogenase family protein [Acidimicrobiia bacterium]
MADTKLFINGEWVEAASGETFPSFAPSTGEKIADVAKGGRDDAQRAIEAARKAFNDGPWPKMSGKERAEKLRKVAEIITARSAEISEIEARDGGGTIKKAMFADIPGGAGSFTFFADCAENEPDEVDRGESPFPPAKSKVRREPYGVTTGIVPWNFPFIMASWKIAPSIAAGNTCVLKPASFTSLSAIEMVKACEEAGIPPGVVNLVTGPGGSAGEELAQHPEVDKVAFTGSTEVGRRIMQLASGTVKKVTLELGGKSANIVLDDADLDLAAAGVLWGTFFHNGQVCESGTRALVSRKIYDEFVGTLVERAGKIVIGDNMDMATDLGPLVAPAQVDTVERYVKLGLDEGAKLLCGGSKPTDLAAGLDPNAYFLPTIFEADNSMKIAQEEIFGPVLCVIPFDSDDEAIKIANDSIYGLGGGVWSKN